MRFIKLVYGENVELGFQLLTIFICRGYVNILRNHLNLVLFSKNPSAKESYRYRLLQQIQSTPWALWYFAELKLLKKFKATQRVLSSIETADQIATTLRKFMVPSNFKSKIASCTKLRAISKPINSKGTLTLILVLTV